MNNKQKLTIKIWNKSFPIDFYIEKIQNFFDRIPREYYVIAFFVFISFLIIKQTFIYTVIDHDKYVAIADKQQTAEQVITVDRWNIFSSFLHRPEEQTIMATSTSLTSIAVDPMAPWNKHKLADFLTDVAYKEYCESKAKKECYDNLLWFLKTNRIESFIFREKELKELIHNKVSDLVFKDKVTSSLIYNWLSETQIFEIEKINLKWVYIFLNNLYVNPEEILDDNLTASELSKITDMDYEDVKYLIRKRNLRYSKVFSKLSAWTDSFLKDQIESEKKLIKKWYLKPEDSFSNMMVLEADPSRYYPENSLWAQITWFVDSSWNWNYWIEGYFNDLLKWKEGIQNFKAWTTWFIIDISDVEEKKKAEDWIDITLTIDRNIQWEIERIIEDWVKKYQANKWSILVMDPNSWRVLWMANYPTYNPNDFWSVYELEIINHSDYTDIQRELRWFPVFVKDKIKWDKFVFKWRYLYLREATEAELLNEALVKYKYKNWIWPWAYRNDTIEYLYEPWSIFKPIVVAMWLDSWDFTPDTMYEDKWKVTVWAFTITNVSDRQCKWYHSYQNALNYSCNTWMVDMIRKVWPALVHHYLDLFWFWKQSSITLSWEENGSLEPYQGWARSNFFTRSYGRWMVTNQLKMATAYSVMANWWIYYEPSILKKIKFWDWRVVRYEPSPSHRVLSEKASNSISEMLVDWVENWLAKTWRVLGYTIAWKTWTASYVTNWVYEDSNNEWWLASKTIGSYAWYWPAEDPKFVVVVRLDRPRTNPYWWQTSAYMFAETAKFLFDYYKIPMTRDPQEQLNSDKK